MRQVEIAIREGYRHIDCAYNYLNQAEVSRASSSATCAQLMRKLDIVTSGRKSPEIGDTHRCETR